MSYAQRIRLAAACSVLINAVLAAGLATALFAAPRTPLALGPAPEPQPIVLNLLPEEQEQRTRQLVDAPVPAETPPEETSLIAEQHAHASDAAAAEDAAERGPSPAEESEFMELAAVPQPEQTPAPPTPPAPEVQPEAAPARERAPEPVAKPEQKPQPAPPPADAPGTPAPPEAPEPFDPLDELMEPFEVAHAPDAAPPTPRSGAPRTRGRPGSAISEGFTSFDALQDEIAPYLREIKRRVEQRWNEALLTRYSGHMPTEATIDCAIAPDGTIVSVQIVGAPKDRIFAALCQDAIRRAGPFPPFPFEVPDIYRNKNLEIHWTFNYLRR